MKKGSQKAKLITGYLLGEFSDEERSRLEEMYFADPELSLEVQAVRDDLIDAYLRGELPGHEREQFEKYFMASPRRRERVAFAEALMDVAGGEAAPSRAGSPAPASFNWWQSFVASFVAGRRVALTAAVLILIAVGSWFAFRSLLRRNRSSVRMDEQVASVNRGQAEPVTGLPAEGISGGPVENTDGPPVTPTPRPSPGEAPRPTAKRETRVATIILTPNLVRGDGGESVVVPRGTDVVLLRFGLDGGDYKSYRAQLRTPEGNEVWSTSRVNVRNTPSGRTATLRVPGKLVKAEDYVLRLSGVTAGGEVEDLARYYFRVETK